MSSRRNPVHNRLRNPYRYLDDSGPIGFAHRGGAADGDENTTAAFQRAVDAGFRYLETDTRSSSDGVAVLFHDETLERLTGDRRGIDTLTWGELQSIRHRGEPLIPRLDEVLAAWPTTRFNIDTKTDAAVLPTLEALSATRAVDRVLVSSFSDARLKIIREASSPRLATGMGRHEVTRLWLASRFRPWSTNLGYVHRAAAVQVPVFKGRLRVVDEKFIQHAHQIDLPVHVWTIDDAGMMTELLDLGVDGIMTDQIDTLADVYRSRGHWPA
ncbi:MAG TPA: glycerophosphodiester phosphodiesterase [Candidatus Stackebrandtia excrementipullorum]|nr:glycerophosphodiester phosphodiesterase [Candidatus Stackebrandtia excrementipullorum]